MKIYSTLDVILKNVIILSFVIIKLRLDIVAYFLELFTCS